MPKGKICQYGKNIKKKLVDIDKTQDWLIKEVTGKTGLFFDSSYLYKIMTGQLSTPKIIPTADGNGVEREIRLADKLKALELLGKHLGMFTDNINLTGDVGVQIIDDIPKNTG